MYPPQSDESFACTELEAVEKIARLQTEVNEVTQKLEHKAQEAADQKTFAASLQVLGSRRPSPLPLGAGLGTGACIDLLSSLVCLLPSPVHQPESAAVE
jgi:hypothetical protein